MMSAALALAPGMVTVPGALPYPNGMDIIADPAALPQDREAIPDDTLIVPAVWAALQGVEVGSVYSNKQRSDKRRGTPEAKRGDMPPTDVPHKIGQTPVWAMRTYRKWDAARPGKGAGAGRPRKAGGPVPRVRVDLPFDCPHCRHEITAADLGRAAGDGKPSEGKRSGLRRVGAGA